MDINRKQLEKDLKAYIEANYVEEEMLFRTKAVLMECNSFDGIAGGIEEMESELDERLSVEEDTFSQRLLSLIEQKKLNNSDVYKDAALDKKVFSKLKNNKDYQPNKLTALRLCIGAKLTVDEAKELLALAGYAFSPCNKLDLVFQFFLERQNYDIYELDIQLENNGLPCFIN